MAFVAVGNSIVGVKADGLLIGCKRFLVALKITEGNAFAIVGVGVVGVKADGLLIGC